MDGEKTTVTAEPTDDALLDALRRFWQRADPVPAGFVDDVVAAVASDDLGADYALLTWIDSEADAAVRGDADLVTMQFSDGQTNILLHVTVGARGTRRVDGWIDAETTEVELLQEGTRYAVTPDRGRFSVDGVGTGLTRLRIVLTAPPLPGAADRLLTPRFEI